MPEAAVQLPEIVPIHPVRDLVAFPYMLLTLFVSDDEVKTFERALAFESLIAVFLPKSAGPPRTVDDFHTIGTVCRVTRVTMLPEEGARVIIEGLSRVRLQSVIQEGDKILGRLEQVRETFE